MPGPSVSRDARQVLEHFANLTGLASTVVQHMAIHAEVLCWTHYPRQVINVINQIYRKSRSDGKNSLDYYIPVVRNMIKPWRREEPWDPTPEECQNYAELSLSLGADWANNKMEIVQWICRQPRALVRKALHIAHVEGTKSVDYVYRVLERMVLEQEEKLRRRERHRLRRGQEQVHKRSRAELATLMYQWQDAIQNVELARKVKELYGRE